MGRRTREVFLARTIRRLDLGRLGSYRLLYIQNSFHFIEGEIVYQNYNLYTYQTNKAP